MEIDLTQIILGIIGLIAAAVSRYIIPFFISKTQGEKRKDAIFWTGLAVQAAEMLFKEKGAGTLKKDYVKKFLAEKGFKYSDQEIDAAIESAVFTMNNAIATAAEVDPEPVG